MVRVESQFRTMPHPEHGMEQILVSRSRLILQGLLLSSQISNLLRTTIAMHFDTGIPLKKSTIPWLCQCVEILKAMECMFHRKSGVITQSMPHIMRVFQRAFLEKFSALKTRLESSKRLDATKVECFFFLFWEGKKRKKLWSNYF